MYGQPPSQPLPRLPGRNEPVRFALQWIDYAVAKARSDILAAGRESVSVWNVSQAALLILQAPSWESLGVEMQQVPSLYRLMLLEGKINASINNIIGLQRITLLYDLEVAICESQGVQRFEELELGPLLHHPLVAHTFSLGPDITEVFGVKSEEINSSLAKLSWKRKGITIGELLGFIAKIRSVRGFDNFCVQMHNLGMHIIPILRAIKVNAEKNEAESYSTRINENSVLSERREKSESTSRVISAPSLPKSEVDKYTRMFVRIWKQTCKDKNVSEVFEQMLTSYQASHKVKRKNATEMFSSYPWAGLLNAAVTSMKLGLWDGMYDDDPQTSGKEEVAKTTSVKCTGNMNSEAEPAEKHALVDNTCIYERRLDVPIEDIVKNICTYIELHNDIPGSVRPGLGMKMIFISKLCKCEHWLTEQFSVKEFESLGYGPFFAFLEKHIALLPLAWKNCFLFNDTSDNPSLEAHMSDHHLKELVVQASNSLTENEDLNKQKISELLTRQFPSVSFNLVENCHVKKYQDIVREKKSNIRSNCVFFSATLHASHNEKVLSETHVLAKDAIEVLLRSPMLIDLNSWSHWDLNFFPSLGPLVGWLLNEVNTKELLCLVTKDGEVIRIDHSATVESFLEAFLQGSSFRTAAILLSLLVLYGGEQFVPLSLLKSHTRKAFEVNIKNIMDLEVNDGQKNLMIEANKNKNESKKAVPYAARFILDCLHHLPAEFRRFAANLLLSGLPSTVKAAPLIILNECKQIKHRIMLHELGVSLGIVEWINDYHTFHSSERAELPLISGSPCLDAVILESITGRKHVPIASNDLLSSPVKQIISAEEDQKSVEEKSICSIVSRVEISGIDCGKEHIHSLSNKEKDAASVIESIRREEFGLDPTLSVTESSMLKKQHARLGRALHCLSQELYSQDSHFLLELVQNADDNVYPADVEPTLTFILQEGRIIILNNEQGFSAENIRALCDVGNSTKKEISAGYIGKKGIGFKSVFRVTDAPEIHSNGFHIKFDIRGGKIGFVLPTMVPPCDIDLFNKLVSLDTDQMDRNCWNTCILLPFKSKLTEAFDKDNIISMFSDLHPSLLLFLHRLQCIKLRNMLDDSLTVMRREVVGGGIVNISLGKEKITWLIESRKLQADSIRHDVSVTEISIAFTLEESGPGNYSPKLDQQPVFAFLPLRTYGLKFIIQGDFMLPSSREEVDADSPWNQWLLSEFPNLFVSAEKPFCRLPCYRENPGKGVSAFMSFVPLVGEVHGFFSSLPRMIIPKLRISNCLLLEGNDNEWVPPCRVLRSWTEHARTLLPEHLLQEHLGLGFLSKDIVITDSLARTLGIQEYGPKILLQIMSSLSRSDNGLKSMGLGWLGSWINALYVMSLQYYGKSSEDFGIDSSDMNCLRQLSFIPLSDDRYGSVDEGTIWLHYDNAFDNDYGLEAFPRLYSNLRMVNPSLFSFHVSLVGNLTQMLCSVGVQKLSAHEVLKVHILPAVSDVSNTTGDKDLMMEYVSFIMFHLQSSCPNCHLERKQLLSEVHKKAFISTNYGYRRPVEVSLHFNKDFGNPIDINKLIIGTDMKWYEVDSNYLKYPTTKSSSGGMLNWRKFFQELGVSDFVCVAQVENLVADISYVVLKNIMLEKESISPGSMVKDWESHELVHLLSQLSSTGDRKRSRYLLEVFDTLWDDSFSDKVTGYYFISNGESRPFKSSLISILRDVEWMSSSMDDELHYPKDLFYDCKAVRSILGFNAPYAIPKVRNKNLLTDISLKTQVTLDDSFSILDVWRRSSSPFRASISQMSNFYTFIWNEIATSRLKILNNLQSGAFIFVPSTSDSREAVVLGVFVSPQELYWYDPIGSLEELKATHNMSKSLCNIYPSLHDFFVKECGVSEIPPLRSYLHFLLQLSTVGLPSSVGHVVFQVFKLWAEGLETGLLSPEDVEHLKENICKQELLVLPSSHDKWISLHLSFGLVCWSDDETLSMEFMHLHSIHFLHFGELSEEEQGMLLAKVSPLMQRLGIPALSEIVTREAIYYGRADSSFKTSLVRWALPYAQRYVYNVYPYKYAELKQSGFERLNHLEIAVVNELLYRNVIKRSEIASAKQFQCNCLLQGNILYTTQESDSHSIFVGLSRFLIDGVPELHLANFLHMIRTMAELGSTTEQTEFFILNSQKLPKLPDEEPIWSLQSMKNEEKSTSSSASTLSVEPNTCTYEGKTGTNSYWRPINSRNTPKFTSTYKTKASPSQQMWKTDNAEQSVARTHPNVFMKSNTDWMLGENADSSAHMIISQNSVISGSEAHLMGTSDMKFEHNHHLPSTSFRYPSAPRLAFGLGKYSHIDSVELVTPSDGLTSSSSNFNARDQLSFGTSTGQQALLTGRLGEIEAFKYLCNSAGERHVKWVNETNETGLPFDILVGDGKGQEYIEVKTTDSTRKDWFAISIREWQFAVEKGDLFSIARVVLLSNNMVRITIYKNPASLCQQGQLQLAILMPN